MKVIAKPIDMITWIDKSGNIHPVRFKITYDDGKFSIVNVDKVINIEKENLGGNPMLVFHCQSLIKEENKEFELKYELLTCKWILWKI